jgi:hypothetical protein
LSVWERTTSFAARKFDSTEARNARQEKNGEIICDFLAPWYDVP